MGIGATALAVMAIAPAAAHATIYCVSDPACVTAGGTNQATVQGGLNAALANPGPDRVEIGTGTFNSGGTDGYFYSTATPGNHVDIVGEGPSRTILTAPVQTDPDSTTTLQVESPPSAGDSSTVSDLKAVIAGATTPCCVYNTGLRVIGAVTRVGVTSKPAPNPTTGGEGINIVGTVSDSVVQLDKAIDGGAGIRVSDGAAGTIMDSSVSAYHGIYTASSGSVATAPTVTRVRIDASFSGIYNSGGSVVAEDVLIALDAGASYGIHAGTDPNNGGTTVLRNGTIIGGVYSAAAEGTNPGQTATLSINSSVLEGSTTSLSRTGGAGTAHLSVRYSNYAPTVSSSGAGALVQGPANTSVADPGFVNPAAGRYQLVPGSPLVDRGDPAALLSGESATDLDGNPRVVRGRRDMGAFELQLPCRGKPATIVGSAAGETLFGTSGPDVIAALGGPDKVRGRGGKDLICGGGAKDRLMGGSGGDVLLGQGGPDILRGGAGRDRLIGGKGRDRLLGGGGRDRLRGGPGRDVQRQ